MSEVIAGIALIAVGAWLPIGYGVNIAMAILALHVDPEYFGVEGWSRRRRITFIIATFVVPGYAIPGFLWRACSFTWRWMLCRS